MHPALTLCRYVLLDAQRSGLHWILICSAVASVTLGWFLAQLGITEKLDIQIATTASLLRLVFAFVIAIWVCAHIIREKHDASIQLLLSLPLKRRDFIAGKLLAVGLIALFAAVLAALPVAFIRFDLHTLLWFSSLGLELWLMGGLALLCAEATRNVTPAVMAVTAFYVLSRSISAMVLIADTALLNSPNFSDAVLAWMVKSLAYILPPLDQFTNSAWLVHHSISVATWFELLLQALSYILLIGLITLWDIEHAPV